VAGTSFRPLRASYTTSTDVTLPGPLRPHMDTTGDQIVYAQVRLIKPLLCGGRSPERKVKVRLMRLIKMIGFAVIAAVAAMAFLSAGTASATRVCETNSLPCASVLPIMAVKAELKAPNEAILKSGFAEIKCKESVIKGKTTNEGGASSLVPVLGEIASATWNSCTCNLGGVVTTGAEARPWSTELHWTVEMNGTMKVTKPKGFFTCAGEKCIYEAESVSVTVTGGQPMTLDANEVVFKKAAGSGLFCSGEATWSGLYTLVQAETTTALNKWVSEK
jgi:hypothetical protein